MSGECYGGSCPLVSTRKVAKKSAASSSKTVPKSKTAAGKKVSVSTATKTVAIKVVTKKVTGGTVKKANGKSAAKLKPPVSKAKNVKSPKPSATKSTAKPKK